MRLVDLPEPTAGLLRGRVGGRRRGRGRRFLLLATSQQSDANKAEYCGQRE